MQAKSCLSKGIFRAEGSLLLLLGCLLIGAPELFSQGGKADAGVTVKNKGGSTTTTYPEGTTVPGGEDNGGDITYPPGSTKTASPNKDYGKGGTKEVYKTPKDDKEGSRTDTIIKDAKGTKRLHKSEKTWPNGSTSKSTTGFREDGSPIGGTEERTDTHGDGSPSTTTIERKYEKDGSITETTRIDGGPPVVTKVRVVDGKEIREQVEEAAKDVAKETGKDAAKDASKGAGKPPAGGGGDSKPAGGCAPCGH